MSTQTINHLNLKKKQPFLRNSLALLYKIKLIASNLRRKNIDKCQLQDLLFIIKPGQLEIKSY